MPKKTDAANETRRFCCESLKERPAPECGKAFKCMGVRKFESSNRMKKRNELEIVEHGKDGKNIVMPFDNSENRRIFEQCYATAERRVNPIAYWTDSDIWDYSKDVGLEQCSLYDEGFTRLGCIGCPMARRAGREQEFNSGPNSATSICARHSISLTTNRTVTISNRNLGQAKNTSTGGCRIEHRKKPMTTRWICGRNSPCTI